LRGMQQRREVDEVIERVEMSYRHLVLRECSCGNQRRFRRGVARIPVLSEQITLTLPSASTLGSFFTMALRRDILRTPRARVTVVTMGKPSGIAATANDTARISACDVRSSWEITHHQS
jgi:hypothetical protein